MKITEDVRKYAADQGVSEQEALQEGMEEKSREFAEKGSELYAKAQFSGVLAATHALGNF